MLKVEEFRGQGLGLGFKSFRRQGLGFRVQGFRLKVQWRETTARPSCSSLRLRPNPKP